MSIQAQCREAMNSLAAQGGIFTEIDVANEASVGRGWNDAIFRRAAEKATNVLRDAYMAGKLVRYAVKFNGQGDYARKGAKIVYAHPEQGPAKLETPNGNFPRLHIEDDDPQPGRKPDSLVMRDDLQPWREQDTRYYKVTRQELEVPLSPQAEAITPESITEPQATIPDAPPALLGLSDEQLDNLVDLLEERLARRLEEPLTETVRHKVAELLIA